MRASLAALQLRFRAAGPRGQRRPRGGPCPLSLHIISQASAGGDESEAWLLPLHRADSLRARRAGGEVHGEEHFFETLEWKLLILKDILSQMSEGERSNQRAGPIGELAHALPLLSAAPPGAISIFISKNDSPPWRQ